MSDIAIRVEGLGKEYRIGQQESYRALRDRLAEGLLKPFNLLRGRKNGHKGSTEADRVWALKDVSFEIRRGEAVGVIGRNGAGKSTLLKILSRIVDPTEGRAEIHGRVGSLLEVGTGFHSELTGRENIYLSGSIIGMKKAEIDRRFDEIVAFAEVEKFVDTMVKYYSSGMYLRLAFGVAAHLEPEILLVDEVLAVGDAAFQKKCLGKMGEVSHQGKTVLFVSHNMAAVRQLTTSSLFLDNGRVQFCGATEEAIDHYARVSQSSSSAVYDVRNRRRPFSGLCRRVEFITLRVACAAGNVVAASEPVRIGVSVYAQEDVPTFHLSFTIFRSDGAAVGSGFSQGSHTIRAGTTRSIDMIITDHGLTPGLYHLGIALCKGDDRTGHFDFDIVMDVCHFEVLPHVTHDGAISRWWPAWGPIRFDQVYSTDN